MNEQEIVKDRILEAIRGGALRKLVLTGDRRKRKGGAEKTALEPVSVDAVIKYRIVHGQATGETTKIVVPDEVEAAVAEMLETPFRHLHLLTQATEMHVRISKKGRYLVSVGKGLRKERLEVRELEHEKERYANPRNSGDLLGELGMLSRSGKIKPTMFAKYRQINRFIELLCDMPAIARAREGQEMNIVDFGCGKAYLAFALFHYLHNLRGIRVNVVGVDRNARLISQCNVLRGKLRYDALAFQSSDVAAYEPHEKPDVVLSLHACDLATDEAIAKGINLEAAAIAAAPCCQHELHGIIEQEAMKPVLRHGILRERTADILTDAFRALVLRIAGYKADVIEFIDPEATSKNIMIRAQRAPSPAGTGYVKEFQALCAFWRVRPQIVDMLDQRHRKILEEH